MFPVDTKLFATPYPSDFTHEQRCTIINIFWPHLNLLLEDYIEEEYSAWFAFLGRTLKTLSPYSSDFVAQDWRSLASIVTDSKAGRSEKKDELQRNIQKQYLKTDTVGVVRSIELAVRFLLGIYVCSRKYAVGPVTGRDRRIEWQEDQSLDEMISTHFSFANRGTSPNVPFNETFTAVNLKNICRVHIQWTDNLNDHLKLEGPPGHRRLSIYQHKICLINHLKAPKPTIIPADILHEAIRTLDLLFPFGDEKTTAFLEEEKVHLPSTFPSGSLRATDLGEFYYWKNNLAQLLNLYHGPPETALQTLIDTRNIAQFATLWVAIIGIFFLTILFGILSTVYSVKQYRVAIKSYELALAQACQQSPSLTGYCH